MKNRSSEQSNIHIISLDLGSLLNLELPSGVVARARQSLDQKIEQKQLRGALVYGFARDLHIHLSTSNTDLSEQDSPPEDPSTVASQAALQAGLEALEEARKLGLGNPDTEKISTLDPQQQAAALGLRRLDFPYTERDAEPIFVAKAINGSWGFFNRAVFNLFFNPDKGSGRRIEGNDFLAIVESIEDLRNGSSNVRTFEFGPANINEMVALIADAEEWRLSRVYAVRGKFGEGKLWEEPALAVGGSINPVMIGRSQSGLPAIGEFTQSAGEFFFGPGGDQGQYRVGLMPATFQEAQALSSLPGTARVVAYAYQSYDKGRIPTESDIVDVFAQNRAETIRVQQEAGRLISYMVGHGRFEPYLNPEAAERIALEETERLQGRFETIPDPDPLIKAANKKALFTLSDIKADSGGKVGHTTPPNHFSPVAEASLEEAKEAKLIYGTSEIIEVGDDGHLLMTHNEGVDSNKIHLFAYRTFFRQVWVAEILGYKWYGLGQDLVGEASEGGTTEELANLTDKFIDLLENNLPPAEQKRVDELKKAYLEWKSGQEKGHPPLSVFSGNVSGQGPGFAELPLMGPARIGLLAMDKTGPSAFNLPIWWSLNRTRHDETLSAYMENSGDKGVVVEIWDVEHHTRAFLDLESELTSIKNLLGAIERFNVKRVWSRKTQNWDPRHIDQSLGQILLAASTEKLSVITGGEYRGKDDPVLLAVEPLAQALNLFMRDGYYMTQGDGRGSHFMFPTPLAFQDAIATINSRAVAVAAWISVDSSGEIREFRDVFADPAYRAARDRAFQINKAIWDAQGGNFVPVGVGSSKVEQSYPLAKTLARITAPDSEFISKRPVSGVKPEELVGT
ncbi:fructose 1,6-bisphosphatase [Acidobacteria bacterium AH-259-D05]|nr:fructose 1,6-bisphosphatase [Acidobacteria bacterium AH-259-D05]